MEIGICYILDDETTENISFLKNKYLSEFNNIINNTLHISLFQLRIEDHLLEECLKKFEYIQLRNIHFLISDLKYTDGNIRAELKLNKALFQASVEKIVGLYSSLRSNSLMEQIDITSLSKEQLTLVEQYGIYWNVPSDKSRPYITLIYGSKGCIDTTKVFEESTINIKSIALVTLGKLGNVTGVIKEMALI